MRAAAHSLNLAALTSLPLSPQPSSLTRSFYVPVHKGPVKCVAAATPFAATGGTDDCIHLFDVRVRGREKREKREGGGLERGCPRASLHLRPSAAHLSLMLSSLHSLSPS